MDNLWTALKGAKRMGWIAVAAVAAAILIVLAGQVEPKADKTALEARMEAVLSTVRGAGRVRVLVAEDESAQAFASPDGQPPARGVVIVADGADDLRVALELSAAAQALLGIDADKIQVLKMEDRP
jgi:hypothetical protein